MRLSVIAKALLALGALVGGLAGLALALGFRLDQFPPWMITVGMYKLAFIAAAGLFVAGAMLGRAARRDSSIKEGAREDPAADRAAVGPGPWRVDQSASNQPDRLDRERRRD